ncbi:MAG TPA: cysteine rich repeat-containing protein [Roseiarcus sp.]|nr:cysteine rich repeat-containing protein [Roseiarcus sp.]
MKTLTSIFALGAVLMLSTSAGYAAPSSVAKSCKADVKKLCADVKPGSGGITACVNEHFKDLSADCQVAIIRVAALGKACEADAKSVCADVKRKAAIPACLKAHAANLSDSCKEAMAKADAGEK